MKALSIIVSLVLWQLNSLAQASASDSLVLVKTYTGNIADVAMDNLDNLYINGLIGKTDKVKVLGDGELKTALAFKVNAVSAKAKEAIEAAGGSIEILK